MSQTRYCSTCGMLLSAGAAICGECGARYQASPYERRATDAPGAWSQAPRTRSRDLGPVQEQDSDDEEIQLISREELTPRAPGATALRSADQYDQVMVTQPPTSQDGSAIPPGPSGIPAAPVPEEAGTATAGPADMDPPLDGCAPASPLKRFLAALIDAVIASLTLLPLAIGLILIIVQDSATLLAQILVGVGVAVPAAYRVLILWLVGSKGFSLGKLILGLRVTRSSRAGGIGFLRSLGRWALYALIPVVMALSIFFDPRKVLRGLHDRAVDSVVVDTKAGRNPMLERPDDFERAPAEHYLGAPSVAVTAHENLLSEPGAAWRDEAAQQAASPQDAASGSDGWGPQALSVDPYAPAPQPSEHSSAPQPPVSGSPWPPAPASAAEDSWAPPPQQSWQAPAQPAPYTGEPAQSGQVPPAPESAPQPGHPAQSWPQTPAAQQGWAPPPPAPPASASPGAPAGQPAWAPVSPGPQQPGSAPAEPSGFPGELTTDAWDEVGIDEDTRLAIPEDGDLGDLEQTRISASVPPVPTLRLVADDGTERSVQKPVVVGRNPSASEEEVLFVFKDDTRSVSKTHLRIDGTGENITVTDLGSTNGSAILREDGSRESLVPNTATVLPAGASVAIGDRTLDVGRTR